MIEVKLTSQEIEELKAGKIIRVPAYNRYGKTHIGKFKIRLMKYSETSDFTNALHDPEVDLVLTPHDIWDLLVDGGLGLDYRETLVRLKAQVTGLGIFTPKVTWPPENSQKYQVYGSKRKVLLNPKRKKL